MGVSVAYQKVNYCATVFLINHVVWFSDQCSFWFPNQIGQRKKKRREVKSDGLSKLVRKGSNKLSAENAC